ncbi:Sodium transporter HKT1 [Linum perenne]
MTRFYRMMAAGVNSFLTQLCYFLSLSFIGYTVLKSLDPKPGTVPRSIDYFFTAVSSATDSSMSTVEMELFSDGQLLFITFLMFLGGEIFISLLSLIITTTPPPWTSSSPRQQQHPRELEMAPQRRDDDADVELKSKKYLCYVVLWYLSLVHVLGVSSLSLYLYLQKTAADILREKRLRSLTFSLFTVVSTFASCGYIPTNENMIVFRKMPGMLLILIPHVLMGNTMFPPFIWMSVWVSGKLFPKKYGEYSRFLLRNGASSGGGRVLIPGRRTGYLTATIVGLVVLQLAMICGLDWNSEGLKGLNLYQKVVGVIFMAVNSRHAGETIVDLGTLSPAVLLLFVVMMYLPPYTSFIPVVRKEEDAEDEEDGNSRNMESRRISGKIIKYKNSNLILENVVFSQLVLLVVFIVVVCITERKNMKKDPLNFNVFNIALEVVSAYGNVGFSMGYSCKRQINPIENCQDKWYGFSGKWSDGGKIVLILVMVFGRLKKFNIHGGKAWKIL